MKKLIEQLERVNWTSFDKYDVVAKGEKDGKAITIEVKFEFNDTMLNQTELPVNAHLSILVDGVSAYRWDMSQQNDQGVFGEWFLKKENEMRNVTYKAKDNERNEAKAFFNAI